MEIVIRKNWSQKQRTWDILFVVVVVIVIVFLEISKFQWLQLLMLLLFLLFFLPLLVFTVWHFWDDVSFYRRAKVSFDYSSFSMLCLLPLRLSLFALVISAKIYFQSTFVPPTTTLQHRMMNGSLDMLKRLWHVWGIRPLITTFLLCTFPIKWKAIINFPHLKRKREREKEKEFFQAHLQCIELKGLVMKYAA